ncbi:MAG: efflux RND transporter periplasmic adaptor subunit [bacterium]|nr:efflux RND transporter periplasmic adaptor subunit [bacterium]
MKKIKWIAAIIIIAGIIFLAYKFLIKNKSSSKPKESIFTVKRGELIVSVNVTGTIEPYTTVEVKSKASGKIINMPVEQGDYLKNGDLIAEIEKTFTQPVVDQAKADLDASMARLEKIKIDVKYEKEDNDRAVKTAENNLNISKLKLTQLQIGSRPEEIKRAQSNLEKAKSNLDLAQSQYERLSKLNEKGFVSKDDIESAKTKLESAQSDYEQALQSLELTKTPATKEDLDMARFQITQAELDLQKAQQKVVSEESREQDIITAQTDVVKDKVALQLAEDNLKDTRVTAPMAGTILQTNVAEGTVISSGMSLNSIGTTIAVMANLTKVYIDADVDETDIGKIQVGQSVKITVDAFPKKNFEGRIIRIAPLGVIVQNVTTFNVRVEIKNPSIILKPGMNASLEMITSEGKDVLFIPNDSIKDKDKTKIVYVIKDDKSVEREVKTGVNNWEFTEIVSGLEEGDVISKSEPKAAKGSDTTRRPTMGLFGGR